MGFQIFVSGNTGLYTITVESTDKVSSLLDRISEKEKIAKKDMYVTAGVNKIYVKKDCMLEQLLLNSNDSTVNLHLEKCEDDVEGALEIAGTKYRVGIRPSYILENGEATIELAGINESSRLAVHMRLRGGMMQETSGKSDFVESKSLKRSIWVECKVGERNYSTLFAASDNLSSFKSKIKEVLEKRKEDPLDSMSKEELKQYCKKVKLHE